MLTDEQVQRVQADLSLGLSQRHIALRQRVSRGSVKNIADGVITGRRGKPVHATMTAFDTRKKPRRCKTCGGLVFMPCMWCAVMRANLKRKR